MPTLRDPSAPELPELELIEREPYTASRSAEAREPLERRPPMATIAVVFAAGVLILVAFAIMSQPGVEDAPRNEEVAQTTVPPSIAPPTSAADDSQPAPKEPIPRFASTVPLDVPGVISGFDGDGSLIVIDRLRPGPVEETVGIVPTTGHARTQIALEGGSPIAFDRKIDVVGDTIVVEDSAAVLRPTFDVRSVLSEPTGGVLMVESTHNARTASLSPLAGRDGDEPELLEWDLPTAGLDVIGAWGETLLLHRANRVWSLDLEGQYRFVAEGELLTYDGRHLARLLCAEVDRCEIAVGPPDEPDALRIPLPDLIAGIPVERWAPSVAISPDGTRLATAVRNGGLSLPLVVDLTTGESDQKADGINHGSPVAWSPDGRWLAYVYTDDVMVWSLDADRSWRITLDRELETLLWR